MVCSTALCHVSAFIWEQEPETAWELYSTIQHHDIEEAAKDWKIEGGFHERNEIGMVNFTIEL